MESAPAWISPRPLARVIGMSAMAVAAVAAILAVVVWRLAPALVLSALLGLCLAMGIVFVLMERRTEAAWRARLSGWIRERSGGDR